MRNIKRLTALMLICIFVLCLVPSCSDTSYALKIGDVKVTPAQYKATAVSIKTQFLTEYDIEETDSLWTQYIDETYSATTQEYLDAMVQSYLIEYNLYSIHFDELGLTLPDETVQEIEDNLESFVNQYGSIEEINKKLSPQGFSYEQYREQFYNEAKKAQVVLHYFGTDSKISPTTYEDLELYYNEYYTKVKHIFLSTKDEDTNDFSASEKEEVKKKAEAILEHAKNGEDFEKLLEEYNEDPGMASNPDGYIFHKDDTSYTRIFHNAAFDMEFNEIRLVQTSLGFHIMKRYPFMTDELSDQDTMITLLQNMKSSELSEILEELKERIGVTYNNSVLTNLSVVNIETGTLIATDSVSSEN